MSLFCWKIYPSKRWITSSLLFPLKRFFDKFYGEPWQTLLWYCLKWSNQELSCWSYITMVLVISSVLKLQLLLGCCCSSKFRLIAATIVKFFDNEIKIIVLVNLHLNICKRRCLIEVLSCWSKLLIVEIKSNFSNTVRIDGLF